MIEGASSVADQLARKKMSLLLKSCPARPIAIQNPAGQDWRGSAAGIVAVVVVKRLAHNRARAGEVLRYRRRRLGRWGFALGYPYFVMKARRPGCYQRYVVLDRIRPERNWRSNAQPAPKRLARA